MNKRQRKKAIKKHCQYIIERQNVVNFILGVYSLIDDMMNGRLKR